MPIQGASAPNNLGKMLVCMDCVTGSDVTGRLFNPFAEGPIPFSGMIEMTGQMEILFDRFGYPQPMYTYRTFHEVKRRQPDRQKAMANAVRRYSGDALYESEHGENGTFIVRVASRRDATWQGEVRWAEKGLVCPFRSELELIRLLSGALPALEAPPGWTGAAGMQKEWED